MPECNCKVCCDRSGYRAPTKTNGGLEFYDSYADGRDAPACKMNNKNNKMKLKPLDKKL